MPARVLAAAASAPGSRSARTSLMMSAPASQAASMTSGLLVSMEMKICDSRRSASMTGMTRAISCAAVTGSASGRVDSPPMSMIRAPSSIMRRAWASAESCSSKRPPSEKESGVTLSTPISTGLPRSRNRSRHCQRATGLIANVRR
jgi:hypothetical protein